MKLKSEWWREPVKSLDTKSHEAAQQRQQQLTKPPGSLGQLEKIAERLAAMQGCEKPALDNVVISVFAADHGIAEEGVSAFPQEVTAEMVRNFARGGAAISVLANELGARLEVINVGTVAEIESLQGVIDQRVAPGSANFAKQAAMTPEQLQQALAAGYEAAERAHKEGCQCFIAGEMGIANTSPATAIASALLQCDAVEIVGPGTGLDQDGVNRKAEIIQRALELHKLDGDDALQVLQYVGGLEIAAIVGAYIRCAQLGIPVVVDGFIASAAAMVALELSPFTADWVFYAHASAEPGYRRMMEALNANPLLDLGLRLGEGSGAATSVAILRLAVALHNGMATFAEASVSEKHK
ncbi:MAG: nicotinate-nucleotide--dimethylbenzimidazole phosphoribosyltransferase [Proteobacteria bacterium]|nr:nicotinate-nucleotide--dimethylbenzimidazole phosphoribosyltransferase [Pseudomonadota bacterium]